MSSHDDMQYLVDMLKGRNIELKFVQPATQTSTHTATTQPQHNYSTTLAITNSDRKRKSDSSQYLHEQHSTDTHKIEIPQTPIRKRCYSQPTDMSYNEETTETTYQTKFDYKPLHRSLFTTQETTTHASATPYQLHNCESTESLTVKEESSLQDIPSQHIFETENQEEEPTLHSLHKQLVEINQSLQVLTTYCVKMSEDIEGLRAERGSSKGMVISMPFDNADQFQAFENQLNGNEDLRERLATEINTMMMSPDPFVGVKSVWKMTLTDQAAEDFVWKGRKDVAKRSVRTYTFSEIFKSTFVSKYNCPSKIFDEESKKYFNYAHDRLRKLRNSRLTT